MSNFSNGIQISKLRGNSPSDGCSAVRASVGEAPTAVQQANSVVIINTNTVRIDI